MNRPPKRSPFRLFHRASDGRAHKHAKRPSDFFGTMAVVVVLTLLIWVWAERAQNRDDMITVVLTLTTPDPNSAVDSVDALDGKTVVTLNGPRGQIDALKGRVEAASNDGRLRVALPQSEAATGEKNIDLTRLLNDAPLFANSGVTVMKTSPQVLKVKVEPVVSKDVTVVLPREVPVVLQRYSFDPQKVTVRGPSGAVEADFSGNDPKIMVDLAGLQAAVVANQRSVEVPVVANRDPRVQVLPSRVKLNFEPGGSVSTVVVPAVGILIERPLGDDGKSKVVIKRGLVLNNVQLRGPSSIVSRYVDERSTDRLQAVLTITSDDIGKTGLQRAVKFPYLDKNVEVVGGLPEVTFDVNELN